MKILGLFLSIMVVSVFADADICDSNWLISVNGYRVRAFINMNAGIDIDEACGPKGNRPLHQAILIDGIDPSVIEVLISEGADAYAKNIGKSTPMDYAEDRFGRVMVEFSRGSSAYQREEAIYNAMMGMGSLSDTFNAIANMYNSRLCNFVWWGESSSDDAVQLLLDMPGIYPDYICNSNNDRPIHLSLKVTAIELQYDTHLGVRTLIDAGADLDAENNDGHSALDLVEIRYNKVTNSMIQSQVSWCRGEISDNEFGYKIRQTGHEIDVYVHIKSLVTEQTFAQVKEDILVELYRLDFNQGMINKDILCPYRGVDIQ